MSRKIIVAGARMGPTQRVDSRAATLARMIALLERAFGRLHLNAICSRVC